MYFKDHLDVFYISGHKPSQVTPTDHSYMADMLDFAYIQMFKIPASRHDRSNAHR